MNINNEKLSQENIKKLQLEQINLQLKHSQKSNWYKNKLPNYIETLEEIQKLPFTSKNELREGFPYDFLAIPKEKIARINATSGSTGIPTLCYFSEKDLNDAKNREIINLQTTGLKPGDILQNTMGLGLPVLGLLVCHATISLGATLIPTGPGNTLRQINLINQLNPTFIYATPSYLQYLLLHMYNEQNNSSLKTAITTGEPISDACKKFIKEKGIEVFETYGMTEFGGPVAGECKNHNGWHLFEDYFYAEIIDPETEKIVPDGEYGELVITSLRQEAMPLIRYRTRDITRIIPGQCPCGRTHRKIEAITHRIDDMMIINGVNVFPSQIEECIYKHISTATNYLIHIKENQSLKKLLIDIELPDDLLNNKDNLKKLEFELIQTLKSHITVTPILNFISKGTLPEVQGKTKRVVKD